MTALLMKTIKSNNLHLIKWMNTKHLWKEIKTFVNLYPIKIAIKVLQLKDF